MKQRGQVALEFIFILLIIIVYLFTVSKPLIDGASDVVNDIERVSRINNETTKISKTINNISIMGVGTKNTVNVFIPLESKLFCFDNSSKIGFSAKINLAKTNPNLNICPNNFCDNNLDLFDNIILNCPTTELSPGNYNILIEKISENEIIVEIE